MSIFLGAKCCTIFSFSGLIFLLIIGMILDIQPLYVKNIVDPTIASKGCYSAAGIYVAFLAVSVVYWGLHEGVLCISAWRGRNTSAAPIAAREGYGTVAARRNE